jgi:hypothetical protein
MQTKTAIAFSKIAMILLDFVLNPFVQIYFSDLDSLHLA